MGHYLKSVLPVTKKRYYFLLIVFLQLSCNNHSIQIDEALLSDYNKIANPSTNISPDAKVDCYLDQSDGMKDKMYEEVTFYNGLTDFLLKEGNSVQYFKVGSKDAPESIAENSPDKDFRNSKFYTEPLSKLEGALVSIVKNVNRTSIFITDFEKIDGTQLNPKESGLLGQIDNRAWGTKYFKDWLLAGNQIDIFATKCSLKAGIAKGKTNYVYTIIFTPKSVISSETEYKKSILKFLLDHDSKVPHFSFSAKNFKIEQEKKVAETGDANDNVIVLENISTTKEKGFEYYSFKSSDLVSFNTDESQKADRRIINKIKITSQNSSFQTVSYGIKVYDITGSFSDFYNSKNQEAPEVKTDAETGKKDTISNIKGYTYKKGDIVEDVFDDLVYNIQTNEIGIKLKPDFAGVPQDRLFKLDIAIKNVQLKELSPDEISILTLNYSTTSISPLANSIKVAIQDVAAGIEGQTIYSIYIQIKK